MSKTGHNTIAVTRLELGGNRYVILPEATFAELCHKAGMSASEDGASTPVTELPLDSITMAEKLTKRRQASGLSQAELARRAEIRCETLNRIERGKTTPDFTTIRKLVLAMDAAERASAIQNK